MTCQHCGLQPATEEWIGEGGTLAYVHGMSQHWCLICVCEAQLAYCQQMAAKIPEREQALKLAREAKAS